MAKAQIAKVVRGSAKTVRGSRFNFNKSQNDRAFSTVAAQLTGLAKAQGFILGGDLQDLLLAHGLDVRHIDQREDI